MSYYNIINFFKKKCMIFTILLKFMIYNKYREGKTMPKYLNIYIYIYMK